MNSGVDEEDVISQSSGGEVRGGDDGVVGVRDQSSDSQRSNISGISALDDVGARNWSNGVFGSGVVSRVDAGISIESREASSNGSVVDDVGRLSGLEDDRVPILGSGGSSAWLVDNTSRELRRSVGSLVSNVSVDGRSPPNSESSISSIIVRRDNDGVVNSGSQHLLGENSGSLSGSRNSRERRVIIINIDEGGSSAKISGVGRVTSSEVSNGSVVEGSDDVVGEGGGGVVSIEENIIQSSGGWGEDVVVIRSIRSRVDARGRGVSWDLSPWVGGGELLLVL